MLSTEDMAILDFERIWSGVTGPKDIAIEFALGLGAAEYYERLRSLALGDIAVGYDPLTVKRVRRTIEEPVPTEMAV